MGCELRGTSFSFLAVVHTLVGCGGEGWGGGLLSLPDRRATSFLTQADFTQGYQSNLGSFFG